MTDEEKRRLFSPWKKDPEGGVRKYSEEELAEMMEMAKALADMDKLMQTRPKGQA